MNDGNCGGRGYMAHRRYLHAEFGLKNAELILRCAIPVVCLNYKVRYIQSKTQLYIHSCF